MYKLSQFIKKKKVCIRLFIAYFCLELQGK